MCRFQILFSRGFKPILHKGFRRCDRKVCEKCGRIISVPRQTIQAYENYILDDDFPDVESDYVLINMWRNEIGSPMRYSTAQSLFSRLSKKTGIEVTAHLLRHTHATELIRAGMDLIYFQERLGHASIQTTIDTYVHLLNEDQKAAYKQYLAKCESG